MTLLRAIANLFRRRRVVVPHYRVEKTNHRKAVDAKCVELANELGIPWPWSKPAPTARVSPKALAVLERDMSDAIDFDALEW